MGTGEEGAVEAPGASSTERKSPSAMVLKLDASRVPLGATRPFSNNSWTIPAAVLTLTLKLCSAQLLITLNRRLFNMYSIMFSRVWLFPTPWTVASRPLCPWDSPGKNTGVGCHALLQGIFPTQGLNVCLLLCRRILYHWATWEVVFR